MLSQGQGLDPSRLPVAVGTDRQDQKWSKYVFGCCHSASCLWQTHLWSVSEWLLL